MSNVQIPNLPLAIAADGNEQMEIVQAGTSKRIFLSTIATYILGGVTGTGTVTSVALSGGTTGLTVGGSPITTAGTITLGGTLGVANGGTGQTTASAAFNALSPITSAGDLILGTGVNTAGRLAIGASGYVLTSNGTTASWQPAAGGGSGTVTSVQVSGGTTGLSYSGGPITTSGTITMGGTLGLANGGTGQTTASAAFNALSPITTAGDLIVGNGANSATRLAIGANNTVLTSNGTTATWAAASTGTVTSVAFSGGTTGLTVTGSPITNSGTITLAGTLALANGGTGQTTKAAAYNALTPITTTGDLVIGNGANSATRLAIGTSGHVLTSNGTTAVWQAVAGTGTVTSVNASGGTTGMSFSGGPITSSGTLTLSGTLALANGGTGQTTAAAAFNALSPITSVGDLVIGNGVNSATRLGIGTNGQVLTSNGTTAVWTTPGTGGTVTSVALSGGTTGLTVSGSPITTSGTITLSGTLAVANGGTGQTTASAAFNALSPITSTGDLIIGNGTNSATRLGIGTNGQVLTSNGTTAVWSTAGGGSSDPLDLTARTVSTPGANIARVYNNQIGDLQRVTMADPLGRTSVLGNNWGIKRVAVWEGIGGNNGVSVFGGQAFSATGALQAVGVGQNDRARRVRRTEYNQSTASATAVAGWIGLQNNWIIGDPSQSDMGGFYAIMIFATGVCTSTNHRLFVGMSNSLSAPTDVNPSTLINMIGVGWDSTDANMQLMNNDGTGTATKTDMGTNFARPSTMNRAEAYMLEMFANPGTTQKVNVKVTNIVNNAVFTATVTTDIPSNTTYLSPRGYASVGGTSAAVGIGMGQVYIEADY